MVIIKFIFIIVGVIIGVLLLTGFICSYCDWHESINSSSPKITFNQFKNLYAIAPKKWVWTSHEGLVYIKEREGEDLFRYDSRFVRTPVEFKTYRDWYRFCRFKKRLDTKKINLARLKKEAELANNWQEDINRYRKKANAELKEMAERIKNEQT